MSFFEYISQDEFLDNHKVNDPIKISLMAVSERHFNPSSGFGIYLCETVDEEYVVIKGNFVNGLEVGQTYEVKGIVQVYRGEKQISVERWHNIQPLNKKGIVSYLQTLQGLKNKAYDIYNVFGQDSIKKLIEDPYAVSKAVRGIGKKSVERWKEQLDKMEESHYLLAVLYGYGLTVKETKKVLKEHGPSIIEKIKANPYFLAKQVSGFGFLKCDRIAREIGFDMRSSFRAEEAITYTLEKMTSFGHVFVTPEDLTAETVKTLNIEMPKRDAQRIVSESNRSTELPYYLDSLKFTVNFYDVSNLRRNERLILMAFSEDDVKASLYNLAGGSAIIIDGDAVYLTKYYFAEKKIAEKVEELSIQKPFRIPFDLESTLNDYLNENGITLADKQYKAVLDIAGCSGGFFILIGNAGSGKTFTLKIILEMLRLQYEHMGGEMELALCAPTGKASKVATRATGIECKTIHRTLEFIPGSGFAFDESCPLEVNTVAVDETSMLDTLLAEALLQAVCIGTKVIFMGDTKQLPSVGPGNVLHDLITSGHVNVIELDVPQRQKENSGIIDNANRIISLEEPINSDTTKDYYMLYKKYSNEILKLVSGSVNNLINNRGYKFEDIQVLTPQKNGVIGTYYLNYFFQLMFNPLREGEHTILSKIFNVTFPQSRQEEVCKLFFSRNDKVIHMKNNYDVSWYDKMPNGEYKLIPDLLGITNGETGVIEEIDEVVEDDITYKQMIVNYEGKYVIYDKFDELEHAYALTVHKSQGSQWKAVLLVMSDSIHPLMLVNNIVYTGITRSEEFCACIGSRRAFVTAIKNEKAIERNTTLDLRIQERY